MAASLALYFVILLFPLCDADLRRPSEKAQNGGAVAVELWCVAKNNADDASLQSALDWACGPGGTDCGPIQVGGPCYDPTDIQNTASFAFNAYFLKNGMTDDSCYFQNSAALSSLNPSFGDCKFPSSLSVLKGNFSSPASAVGLGPSEDMNGCDRTKLGPLIIIITNLIVIISRLIMPN